MSVQKSKEVVAVIVATEEEKKNASQLIKFILIDDITLSTTY